MKKAVIKWLVKWFVIKANLYLWWSKKNQKWFQKEREPLPELEGLGDLMKIVGTSKWTADTWWMLWDAVSHPEYAYWNYKKNGTLGDCDDTAALACHYTQQWYDNTRILSMQWVDEKGKFHGHNVCIFDSDQPDMTTVISNGHNYAYTTNTVEDAMSTFVRGGELLSWFTFKPDLSEIIEWHIL